MSVALLSSALHALVGCRLSPSRDGILIVSPGGSPYDLVTVRSDEGELLGAVEALAEALRARGAIAAATPAPVALPAPAMPLAFTSALPVDNIEAPPDTVIHGGKVTQVQKVDAPKWEAPAAVPVAVKRRAKGAK